MTVTAVDSGMVAIFARLPQLGAVKTRLAKSMGEEAALQAYNALVANTLSELRALAPHYIRQLWLTDTPCPGSIDHWLAQVDLPYEVQRGTDLGLRMACAIEQLVADWRRVIIVGVDCVGIDHRYVKAAFDALQTHDLVIGPAEDGGYGLIGMNQLHQALFVDIAWGTSSVLDQTFAIASRLKLRVATLPTIWDVDVMEDWARFIAHQQDQPPM